MKSVAIIGAGPAGLVTAKTLLAADGRTGFFKVSVFEKKDRLGGIWALDEASTNEGFLSAHTPTNLSQFQVAFSDLAWDSVDCSSSNSSPNVARKNGCAIPTANSRAPIFPKAWHAGQYLRAYAQKYIPAGAIHYSTRVKNTRRVQDGIGYGWEVTVQGQAGEKTSFFDHLVVASGFFSQPRVPNKELDPFRDNPLNAPVKTIHTSQFRGLADLFPEGKSLAKKKILIFGGGNSAGETAGSIAFAISSERHGSKTSAQLVEGTSVVLVVPRPLYALPPYVPASEANTGFVPIDLRFYDLAARPVAEIQSTAGKLPQDVIDYIHSGARKYIGGDQTELGADAIAVKNGFEKRTLQASLTENFAEFVRSGEVAPLTGRVVKIEPQAGTSTVRALVKAGERETWIEDIGAVVHATGYTPDEALAFLPDSVKASLGYDPASSRLPLLLDEMQTVNRKFPELGFVGFYEGPYWGMAEMQARLLTQRWLGRLDSIDRPAENKERLLQLREGMAARDADVPQYWMGDYVGHMEHFSRDLKLDRNDKPFDAPRQGALLPARFTDKDTNKEEADKAMRKVYETLEASKKGAFVARAAIRALQGKWSLHRRIHSTTADFPSGVFEGIAFFHPRLPTGSVESGQPFDFELLYVEKGAFIADNGLSFQASRRYVYRYSEAEDRMSVWFVKDDEFTVDYLFHYLTFSAPPGVETNGLYTAKAEHLCVADLYKTDYEFDFNGVSIRNLRTIHNVKGPRKDYVSTSEYERPPID